MAKNIIEKFMKNKSKMSKLRRTITCLAAVVVFATTYALILPAMTLDGSDAQKTPGIDTKTEINVEKFGQSLGGDQDSGSDVADNAAQAVNSEEKDVSGGEGALQSEGNGEEAPEAAMNSEGEKANGSDSKVGSDNKANDVKDGAKKDTAGSKDSKTADDNKDKKGGSKDLSLITEKTEIKFDGKGYKVIAEVGADAKLPADVQLKVKEINKDTKTEDGEKYAYDAYCDSALKAVRNKDGKDGKSQTRKVRLFDITFVSDSAGGAVEPAADVKVSIEFDKAVDYSEAGKVRAVHFDDSALSEAKAVEARVDKKMNGKLKKEVLNTKLENAGGGTLKEVSFEADKFSVYGVVYTVDFHWDVDGQTYEYSIPGGGAVTMGDLLPLLGVINDDENTDANEVELFLANIEDVRFSDESLVKVAHVEEDTTVGALKNTLGLAVEYSEDLTEEEIAQIDAQELHAGDWVLISLAPFTSEETLTVTMKNGDVFTVQVTDASKLAVNYDSLNAAIDANNGNAKFLLYASKNSVNYYLKNDGTTTTTPPSESTLNNYTWTVSISNRNNHQYYFKGRNGLYLNLNQNGLTSTASGAVILTQDGTQFKMTTSSRSMGWDGNKNKFYKRDDINPAKFNLYYVDPSDSSGGSSGTPGIVLTDQEREDLETWKNTLAQFNTLTDYDKTAEVVGDGDNRMYKVDLSASSGIMDFYKDVDLGFVLDVSNSMKFPSSLKAIDNTQIMMTQNALNNYYWAHQSDYNREGCFYIISDPAVTSTIYKVFYDSNGTWKYVDASEPSTTTKIYTITDSTVIGKDGYRKPYTLYYADDTKDRFTYLKESVDYAVETLHKIVKPTEGTDDETANVRIAYNFFCATITKSEAFKDLRDAANNNFTIPLSYSYTASGTKQNEALYDASHSISGLSANEFGWDNDSDQYVILVTDGAPNGPSMDDVRTAAANLKKQYPNVKIITIGLSTKDVEGGSQMLYDIADDVDGDGRREFYEAEKAKDLEYILLNILQSIMAKGTVKGTITDTIDKAFYPVDSLGNPLSAGVYNASGKIDGAQISDYVSNGKPTAAHKYDPFYILEQVGDEWKITWYNQKIGWDDGLAETGNPWKGTVYVKAKEDYLGGNLIETNDSAAIQPTGLKLIIDHVEEEQWRDLEGMPEIGYPVPRVNVHNLETDGNETTWTVYKGTSVTPKEQIEALWNNIPIEEVVSASEDGEHKRTTGASANVGKSGTGETFTLGSLMSEVAPNFDIDDLIDQITTSKNSASEEFTYSAYGHESGKITVKVERTVGNQTPVTHDADTVGAPVEQYRVTFTYKPYTETERMNGKVKDPTDTDHHNGSNGRGNEETGLIKSENTHTINVYVKGFQITKKDQTFAKKLKGAEFKLYRTARDSESKDRKIGGVDYHEVAVLDMSSNSTASVNSVAALREDENYYLVETKAPAGYVMLDDPIPVTLEFENSYTMVPSGLASNTKPESDPYNWIQGTNLLLNTSGAFVKKTDANGNDISNNGVNASAEAETVYFDIANDAGIELPSAGGPGTTWIYILGALLTIGSGMAFVVRRRLRA